MEALGISSSFSSSSSAAPPRLAPVSGVFQQSPGVIKPIACRPLPSSASSTPVFSDTRTPQQQPTMGTGRVADLSRRFGGSLCSVASANPSATGNRQPPAYRHPPRATVATLSNSEVHLDRVARDKQTRQWVMGGSEINLSSLENALPQRSSRYLNTHMHRDNAIYSCPHTVYPGNYQLEDSLSSCSSNRNSWAATQSSNGSTSTLAADCERLDDTATPIVQHGRFRTIVSGSTSMESPGSFGDFDVGTPSPSDSGIAELEALLKEKDSEINLLRETLEKNEAVIFQVYQEKEKSWERELKKLRLFYEERIKAAQQQTVQTERQAQQQLQQWQSEKKQLKQQLEQLQSENEEIKNQLEETSWNLCQKNGELSLVKAQLREAQADQNQRCQEVVKLRSQLKESQESFQNSQNRLESAITEDSHSKNSPMRRNKIAADVDTVQQLRNEVYHLRQITDEQTQQFDTERQVWQEEKSTVLVYQRHLHQQYIQVMKRNQQLEETLGMLGFNGIPASTSSSPSFTKKHPLSSPHSICSDPITIDLDTSSNSSNGESQC